MSWIDVSLPIRTGMLGYAGDPPVRCDPLDTLLPGRPDTYNTTQLSLSSHTGTHVDAPHHFLPEGATIDEVPLELLCGPAEVVDLPHATTAIGATTLSRFGLEAVERLLLKTRNGELLEEPFTEHYAHLTETGAQWLRGHGVRLVGIDYLSIEKPDSPGFPVHHALLGATPPILIVEGLDLRHVPAGRYELCVLPLRIAGGDGAPARAMLRPR